MLRVAQPEFLWLLLLVPVFWHLAGRLRAIPTARRLTIIGVRTLLILCVVLALARLERRHESKDLSVFFLLDRSDSIPPDRQQEATALLESLAAAARGRDEVGVIAFGDRPSLETSSVQGYEYEGRILSEVEGTRTDIASAMRLAMAAFPADRMRRMVLISDGNENKGSALEAARYARNNGVPVDAIALHYDAQNDLRVDKIVVPQHTAKDAPFDIRVFLEAEQETTALLRIFEDGQLIAEDNVVVRPGRNAPLVIPRRLTEGGFHTYTATVEAANDLRPQNNTANAFTYLRGEPHVLIVEGGELDASRHLVGALQVEGIKVSLGGAEAVPLSLEEMQRYDTIIFSNVSAGMTSLEQMRLIERGVHDLGVGFIMIGGENSFGAGGWIDTPIETALPVTMDVKQKKMLPNGALVVVLHTCEIANGNAWAREISVASLNVLSAQDHFGLVYYGAPMGASGGYGAGWGDNWAWEPAIQLAGDKRMMRNAIKGVQPLDMQTFDPSLRLAADQLVKVKAQTKHIVVISDGDPAPPSEAVVKSIRDNGITVSAVAISPHNGQTVETLKRMAYWGSGNFYFPQSPSELPRIFTKEATVVRRSMIYESPFAPVEDSPSEVLLGFSSFPQLEGYVVTSIKDLATQALVTDKDDPLLAHWRHGLGKSVAFTSDAKDKWASPWVQWGRFAKFWAQVVRWSLRETNNANFQVNTELRGGMGYVTIDALDDGGNFRNFLDFGATVIGPDFDAAPLDVRQVAPGRYEGTFPAGQVGTYMLSMTSEEENQQPGQSPEFLTSGVSLSYSPEYQTSKSSEDYLRQIADASGGKFIEDPAGYFAFNRDLTPTNRPEELWPLLLLLAALLLPADIFLRRVYLNWPEMGAFVRERLFGIVGRRNAAERHEERMAGLNAAKARALQRKEEEQESATARQDFRERLANRAADAPREGNLFASPDQPAGREAKQDKDAPGPGGEGAPPGGGMSSLMEAKKRAQQQQQRRKKP